MSVSLYTEGRVVSSSHQPAATDMFTSPNAGALRQGVYSRQVSIKLIADTLIIAFLEMP